MEHSAQNPTERAIAGDGDALAALWTEHRSWVAAVVLAVQGESAQLEDTLQEVALAVARDIQTLGSPDTLRPWLRSVARNVAVSAVRRRRQDRALAADAHLIVSPNGDAQSTRAGTPADDLEAMMGLIAALPEDYREPLLLRATRAMPIPIIAEILGLTPAAVETRLRRARAMLREAAHAPRAKGVSP